MQLWVQHVFLETHQLQTCRTKINKKVFNYRFSTWSLIPLNLFPPLDVAQFFNADGPQGAAMMFELK